MRGVIVLVVIVCVLVLIGWITFSSPDGNPTLQFDSERAKQDTERVVDGARDMVDSTADQVDDRTEPSLQP